MIQQINLYQPMFRRQEKTFSAVAILQVIVIGVASFGLIYAYSFWQLQQLEGRLSKVSQQAEQMQMQVKAYEARQESVIKSKLLESEIARLSKEVEQGERISGLMSKGSFGNTTGFSNYFESLARGHIEGMWLTRINISQGGNNLNLDGVTLSAQLVPAYLQKLSQEKVFSGTGFNVMELYRSDEESGQINFMVSTGNLDNSNEIAQAAN